MVTKVDAYRCELCFKDHRGKLNAEACEQNHLKPVDEVTEFHYEDSRKYPDIIRIRFHNKDINEELLASYRWEGIETIRSPIPKSR